MNYRFKQFMAERQLSASRMAEILGVQSSAISHIISGRNKPGYDIISKLIINFPDLDIGWLLTGTKSLSFQKPIISDNIIGQEKIHDSQKVKETDNNVLTAIDQPVTERPLIEFGTPFLSNESKVKNTPTDINTGTQMEHPEMVPEQKKDVKSIVILYTDGSFDIYKK